jgi:hypothetical protein
MYFQFKLQNNLWRTGTSVFSIISNCFFKEIGLELGHKQYLCEATTWSYFIVSGKVTGGVNEDRAAFRMYEERCCFQVRFEMNGGIKVYRDGKYTRTERQNKSRKRKNQDRK